jgi:membrane-anchored protein YejM (alkaline phosphatase superfamily)
MYISYNHTKSQFGIIYILGSILVHFFFVAYNAKYFILRFPMFVLYMLGQISGFF